jgi:glycosyltransferase involved in cell wall biosynthesis
MVETAVLEPSSAEGRRAPEEREPNGRLRLLVLTLKPHGMSPGQRFRLEQWAPHLARTHGVDMDFLPFESPRLTELLYQRGKTAAKAFWVARDFFRRAGAVLRARRYDAVVIYREAALIGPAIYERLLARSGVPLFFDFDDAIWREQSSASVNGIFSRLHFWGKTATTCRIATGVIAGNNYLADYARQQNPNVTVIPTTIELDHYPVQPEPRPDDPFIVGWTGSTSTLFHFEHARTALERLASERRIAVKVICNQPPANPIAGAENLFVPWSEHGEAEAVGACHAGIMPLQDNDFTRGKCGLKAIQFMATGRPVVISPVGMNCDLIEQGRNGFLAASDDDWVQHLRSLADSPELRARIGAAGRETVEQGYSAQYAASRFNEVVRAAVAARAVPATDSRPAVSAASRT